MTIRKVIAKSDIKYLFSYLSHESWLTGYIAYLVVAFNDKFQLKNHLPQIMSVGITANNEWEICHAAVVD